MLADRGVFSASFLNINQNKMSKLSSALNKMKVCVVAVVAPVIVLPLVCDWTVGSV